MFGSVVFEAVSRSVFGPNWCGRRRKMRSNEADTLSREVSCDVSLSRMLFMRLSSMAGEPSRFRVLSSMLSEPQSR